MAHGYWYLFHDGALLLPKIPGAAPAPPLADRPPLPCRGRVLGIGALGGALCYACECLPPENDADWLRLDLRAAYTSLDPAFVPLLPRARQMLHWDAHSLYCPACGGRCQAHSPLSKRCAACGHEVFPNMSTAVLALVHRDDSILLVRAHNFKGDYHSCVAGYVEPGESLEDCVRREIFEETALEVDGLRYFGSAPWPFPSVLMAAFTARYVSGDVIPQQSELSHAAFFPRSALPELPPPFTFSRRLIDSWIAESDRRQ